MIFVRERRHLRVYAHYYEPGGGFLAPVELRSRADVDEVVDFVVANEQPFSPFVSARVGVPGSSYIAGVVRFDVDSWGRCGAMAFWDGVDRTCVAVSAVPPRPVTPTLYVDRTRRVVFPPEAVVRLSRVRVALDEFRVSGRQPELPGGMLWQEYPVSW